MAFYKLNLTTLTFKCQNIVSFLFLIALITTSANTSSQEIKFSFTREKMASPFTIIFYDTDSAHAADAAEKVLSW
jgi:hypothetical protein